MMLKGNLSNYTALQAGYGFGAAGPCPVQAHTETLAQIYNPYVDFQ